MTPQGYGRDPFAALTPQVAAGIAACATLVLLVRLWGLNWDAGSALHPDARHMFNMISQILPRLAEAREAGMGWVEILFSTETSPLNVRAHEAFYVYGDLPLNAQSVVAYALGLTGYTEIIGLVRTVSALVFASSVIAVCLTALILSARTDATLLAGVLFALAPSAFQNAGFGTVDVWLMATWAWATLGMVLLIFGGGGRVAIWTGLCMAAAVSTKVTGAFLGIGALTVLFGLAVRSPLQAIRIGILGALAFGIGVHLFSSISVIGLFRPDPAMLADLQELRVVGQSPNFPPNWQWQINETWTERIGDIALFGIGPVILVGCVTGFFLRPAILSLVAAVVLPLLATTVFPDTAALRYAAPALAPLAVVAALGFARVGTIGVVIGAVAAIVWGSGIVRLHLAEHSRIAASLWLMEQPVGTVIAVESPWDDGLPLAIPDNPLRRDHLTMRTLGLEAGTDADKVDRLVTIAAEADLIVVSSGRFAEVQPHMADRFPVSVAWYAGLTDGSFCLNPVWQNIPGYPILHWRIDDTAIQEPWTVYDHPPVTIYAPTDCFDPATIRAALTAALPRR